MELTNTRKRFQKRVEFERKIITLVNSIPSLTEPLHGISQPAIETWQKANLAKIKDSIPLAITSLAKDLMVFCDSSKNTFDLDKRTSSSELNKKIDNFELLLHENMS